MPSAPWERWRVFAEFVASIEPGYKWMMDIGRFGFWRMIRSITPEMAVEAEALGFGAIWLGGSPTGDLEQVETLIAATRQIPIVTGIVNMWREPAELVASSYDRLEDRHPGRFILGVGIGHPEATSEYRSPLAKINDYLNRLEQAGIPKERLILAALGPRALGIAGKRTAGAHPYLTTPRHTAFARDVIGNGALLAPEQKVVLGLGESEARAIGRRTVSYYLDRVNYRNNLRREGWSDADFDESGSDALVDELALHGDVGRVVTGIRAHLDAGADHVGIQVLGDDPMTGYRMLAEAL